MNVHRYLVTGAAGFIGSRVCHCLLEDGHEVVGIDNFSDAYDVRLKKWRLGGLVSRERFRFLEKDICRRDQVGQIFETAGPLDGVVNLAARAGVRPSVKDPWVYYETNVVGSVNLLEASAATDVKKFVLASTSSLYGEGAPQPFHEELSTDRPLSPYAASKKAAETLCHSYHHTRGLDITVFRYFTVYGPAGRPDMSLFRFVQWISEGRSVTVFGDGLQSRDFTYVDDIARGTALGLRPLGYEIVNLGSDEPVVLMDAIRLVEELVGKKAELVFQPRHVADVSATWADIGKARTLLGWRPQCGFAEGVRRLVEWYRDNRSWASRISTDD